jgi:hypothetical protein
MMWPWPPQYSDGQPIKVGDRILIDGRIAAVVLRLVPVGSKAAEAEFCSDTGGILVQEEWPGGRRNLVMYLPEDAWCGEFDLVQRGEWEAEKGDNCP